MGLINIFNNIRIEKKRSWCKMKYFAFLVIALQLISTISAQYGSACQYYPNYESDGDRTGVDIQCTGTRYLCCTKNCPKNRCEACCTFAEADYDVKNSKCQLNVALAPQIWWPFVILVLSICC